jgi:hypothetical protein
MAHLEAIATAARRLVALVASAATALACSGGDGSNENPPVRVTIPVPAGSATHQLTAGTPSTSVHPVVLDPSIGVAGASLDLAATLSQLDITVSARAPRQGAAGGPGPAAPLHILGPGDAVGPGNLVPARTIVDTFIVPGRAHTTVAPTTAGTEVQFVARDGQGVQLDSATCTVGNFTWTEIPAEVVWQQTSDLTCSW